MSTFEIIVAIFFSVIILIIIGVPLFMVISGTVKKQMDEEYGNTGKLGWVVAILIAGVLCFACYKACQAPDTTVEYRHTDHI